MREQFHFLRWGTISLPKEGTISLPKGGTISLPKGGMISLPSAQYRFEFKICVISTKLAIFKHHYHIQTILS